MEKKGKINEAGSHRIISPTMLVNKNNKEIVTLLKQIAKENGITVGDAATALSEALKKYAQL